MIVLSRHIFHVYRIQEHRDMVSLASGIDNRNAWENLVKGNLKLFLNSPTMLDSGTAN